jgi:hypothetical protein
MELVRGENDKICDYRIFKKSTNSCNRVFLRQCLRNFMVEVTEPEIIGRAKVLDGFFSVLVFGNVLAIGADRDCCSHCFGSWTLCSTWSPYEHPVEENTSVGI